MTDILTKTYRYSNQRVLNYINGFADGTKKKMFSQYSNILEGNSKLLQEIDTALDKLREQYCNPKHTFLGCSSLLELYKIRQIAQEQYFFYFNNTLLFKGFSDLKKLLKYYIEAIARWGESVGLDYNDCLRLCAKTFEGSAKMILSGEALPEELIARVCSPGGTTLAAMEVLKQRNASADLKAAADACTKRAYELGKM